MELRDIEFAKTKNHPSIVILRNLLMGGEVKLEGRKIRLAERVGGSYSPVIICDAYNSQTGVTREVALGADEMTLSYFLKQCEKLTDDDLAVISASTVLTEINRRER